MVIIYIYSIQPPTIIVVYFLLWLHYITIIIITFHYYGYSIDYNPIIQFFQLWWLLLPLSLIIYYSLSHYYPIIITLW